MLLKRLFDDTVTLRILLKSGPYRFNNPVWGSSSHLERISLVALSFTSFYDKFRSPCYCVTTDEETFVGW